MLHGLCGASISAAEVFQELAPPHDNQIVCTASVRRVDDSDGQLPVFGRPLGLLQGGFDFLDATLPRLCFYTQPVGFNVRGGQPRRAVAPEPKALAILRSWPFQFDLFIRRLRLLNLPNT